MEGFGYCCMQPDLQLVWLLSANDARDLQSLQLSLFHNVLSLLEAPRSALPWPQWKEVGCRSKR